MNHLLQPLKYKSLMTDFFYLQSFNSRELSELMITG